MKILVLNAEANFLFLIKSVHLVLETSYIYLKGQLDPPVTNGHIFAPKEVSWISLLVRHVFAPKEVSWTPVSDVTFFGPKEVSWTPRE